MVLVVKNPPANAGYRREPSLIPGLGRCPGGGHGNPLQDSCLENPINRGTCQATVHRITKSWIWLSNLVHTHARIFKKKKKGREKETHKANKGCCWKPKFRLACTKVLSEGLWVMPWQYLLHFKSNPSWIGPSVWLGLGFLQRHRYHHLLASFHPSKYLICFKIVVKYM